MAAINQGLAKLEQKLHTYEEKKQTVKSTKEEIKTQDNEFSMINKELVSKDFPIDTVPLAPLLISNLPDNVFEDIRSFDPEKVGKNAEVTS